MEGFGDIKRRCLENGVLFEDEDFSAENSSLYFNKDDPEVVWKRPKEIYADAVFMSEGASKNDIAQGAGGNCWFLSATAVLTTQPKLFQKVVPPNQGFEEEYCGAFWFRIWRFGRWVEVVIDDRLPTKNNSLLFSYNRGSRHEFWSALFEKAYAKLHGSYQALDAGYSDDALVDFTGGMGEFVQLRTVENQDKLFKLMCRLRKRKSMMCSAIEVLEGDAPEAKLDNGLVTGHAYSITGAVQLVIDDVAIKLIRVRNPWGYKEWNGAWSDGSSEWQNISAEKQAELGLTVEDEGEFWMPYSDWLDNFHTLQICHLTPDSVGGGGGRADWCVEQFNGAWINGVTAGGCSLNPDTYWLNPQYYVRLTDPDEGDEEEMCTLVVSLMQKFTRLRRTAERRTDTDAAIAFNVYQYHGDAPEELDGIHSVGAALMVEFTMTRFEFLRERCHRFKLPPGVYCIIPCTYAPDTEGEYLLRVATESPTDAGEVDGTSGGTAPSPITERKFDLLFRENSGEDEVVDWKELRSILNAGFLTESDEGFSKETCRNLVKSCTGDRRGTLDKANCKLVWRKVKAYQTAYDAFDADKSGSFSITELRKMMKSLGITLSRRALVRVAQKYCGKDDLLSLDDVVLCGVKVEASQEVFADAARRSGSSSNATLTYDELLELAL